MKLLPYIVLVILIACGCAVAQGVVSNCPEITVVAPSGLTAAGETMTFTANVTNFSGPGEIKYAWSVSAGTIERGQGTPSIVVKTPQDMGSGNVTAVLNIEGLPSGCVKEVSETVPAASASTACGMPMDIFGRMSRNDVIARIDNFMVGLNNDSEADGFILIRLKERESRKLKLSFLNNIYDAMVFLKFDLSRVSFLIVKDSYDTEARVWLLPVRADSPDSEGGALIKGTEFKQKIKDLFKTNK